MRGKVARALRRQAEYDSTTRTYGTRKFLVPFKGVKKRREVHPDHPYHEYKRLKRERNLTPRPKRVIIKVDRSSNGVHNGGT